MRLRSKDGAQVELRPMGYEFAATENRAVRDWDANWLVVDGRVRLSDGRQWSFQDPCLTTWEARELSAWLTAVAAGQMAAVPFHGGTEQDEERLMTFTEPNLAFSGAACGDGEVTVRVHLSFESGQRGVGTPAGRAPGPALGRVPQTAGTYRCFDVGHD